MRAACMAVFWLILALPSTAAAQYVRGSVVQSDTGEPVQGALVMLLQEDGAVRARVLTNEAGRFLLAPRAAGRYTLLMQRIGFSDVRSEPFDLPAGTVLERDVLAAPQAIVLEQITAEARRRCVSRPRQGLAVATLWGEVRKALHATALTDEEALYRFRVHHYTRDLELRTMRVLRERTRGREGFAERSPFISLEADRLLTEGFVHVSDSSTYYFAPDAHVLLSDGFLSEYCFRIEEQRNRPGLIGLAFEPAERRGPPAVNGTLWLDRSTFELRHLEYGYTRVALAEGPSQHLGGRVEFEALPNGAWIVRRWRIRMPHVENRLTVRSMTGRRGSPVITGLLEEGGEVVEVMDATGDRRVLSGGFATLSGTVFDSASAIPLDGAIVHIAGTERSTIADEDGTYRFEDLREGEYTVVFAHPRLALYEHEPSPVRVSVAHGAAVAQDLAVPLSARGRGPVSGCQTGAPMRPGRAGILHGVVTDEFSEEPLAGARVTLWWDEVSRDGASITETRTVITDRAGKYIACSLPQRGRLQARVAFDERNAAYGDVNTPGPDGIAEIDFSLRMTDPQQVVIVVLDFEARTPIRDAAVELAGLDLRGVTDRFGRVTFPEVRPGRHQLRVEHLGYGTHVSPIAVAAEPGMFEVHVPAQALALRGIEVTVRSARELRRRGRGVRQNVIDREEVERLSRIVEHVGHLAERIPGLRVQETYYATGGGLRDGVCVRSPRGASVRALSADAVPCAVVFLDDLPVASGDILLSLSPDVIEAIEFINAVEAGPRYGTMAGQAGVLLVWTRGNGPYARR